MQSSVCLFVLCALLGAGTYQHPIIHYSFTLHIPIPVLLLLSCVTMRVLKTKCNISSDKLTVLFQYLSEFISILYFVSRKLLHNSIFTYIRFTNQRLIVTYKIKGIENNIYLVHAVNITNKLSDMIST